MQSEAFDYVAPADVVKCIADINAHGSEVRLPRGLRCVNALEHTCHRRRDFDSSRHPDSQLQRYKLAVVGVYR